MLKTRELVIIVCVVIGAWFGGVVHGTVRTGFFMETTYVQLIEEQNIEHRSQLDACYVDFLGMTEMFAVAVHDLTNMKCPDIAEQLKKIPGLEHLQ
jgi:hypothetical protein